MTTDAQGHELHGANASQQPPPGAAADWTVPQAWERFTAQEHRVWDTLFARQVELLPGRAVAAFERNLDVLRLDEPGIPRLDALNERLHAKTGWSAVAVPGLLPDDIFFRHLSERRFPAGNFIRAADQLDYLIEPDVFHDVFGHVPLLADPEIADFMQRLGELGLEAAASGDVHRFMRLYWYTVEFGLAREQGALRIYGAGILSSFGETRYAIDDPTPKRLPFALETVLRTFYRSDIFQQTYFVIDRFEAVLDMLGDRDVIALLRELEGLPDLSPMVEETV